MKKYILSTIILTSLITVNANAATYIMQTKKIDNVQVLEGNKGSEVPVVQQPATPSQPTANFILLSNPEFKGAKVGYYDNMNCISGDPQTSFGIIMNEWNADSFIPNQLDTTTFSFTVHNGSIGVKYKTNYDLIIPEMVEAGYEAYAGYTYDPNGVLYFFDDLNTNKVKDAGERSFYIGAQFSFYDAGSETTNNMNSVCIKTN